MKLPHPSPTKTLTLLLSVDDGTGIVSLWDTVEERQRGAGNTDRFVDMPLTTDQLIKLFWNEDNNG